MFIQPFMAYRPNEEEVEDIVSQPYDVVDTDEARGRVKAIAFMHVVRPEIDFPAGTDPSADFVHEKARDNLQAFLRDGHYIQEEEASYYIYRLNRGPHQQTGLACRTSIDDYLEKRIKPHERTKPDKVSERLKHIFCVGANTGSVFMMYDGKKHESIAMLLDALADDTEPVYDISMQNGIRHRIYRISDRQLVNKISFEFMRVKSLYIADGHHRADAAVQNGMIRRANTEYYDGKEGYNWFLTVAFPDHQLRILPYHRGVKAAVPFAFESFLKSAAEDFNVESLETGVMETSFPEKPGQILLYSGGRCYLLTFRGQTAHSGPSAAVDSLDVSILQNYILAPHFGIQDPARNPDLVFIGGLSGRKEVKDRVDSGELCAGFIMYPVQTEQLRAVADAGLIMPPKSTWFDPKMRSGFLLNPVDDRIGD